MIYLATPYSSKPEENYRTALWAVGELTDKGFVVFSPITYYHNVAKERGLPGEYEFWRPICEVFIKASKVFLIYQMEGWNGSEGIEREQLYCANVLNRPIYYATTEEIKRITKFDWFRTEPKSKSII